MTAPSEPQTATLFPRPLYIVLCHLSGNIDDEYEPISRGGDHDVSPSMFDEDLLPALPGIWYALHLPKTRFEVLDLPAHGIRDYTSESRKHQIRIGPVSLLDRPDLIRYLTSGLEPVTVICPEDAIEQAATVSNQLGFVLAPLALTNLTQATLDEQWNALAAHWANQWPVPVRPSPVPGGPAWSETITHHGSELPRARLRKLMNWDRNDLIDSGQNPCESARKLFYERCLIETTSRLEDRGVGRDEAERIFEAELAEALGRLKIPLAISLAGTAPRYLRSVRELERASRRVRTDSQTETPTIVNPADPIGTQVRSLMVAHQSSGDESMGVVFTQPIPPAAFVALANLERHWVQGPEPRKEEQLRLRLDATMEWFWTDEFERVFRRATRIDAFTDFPIGLLRPPGCTAPLAALMPIAYRPLNPLTRALQFQFNPELTADLSNGFKVLIAECIPSGDPAGDISRGIWDMAISNLPSEAWSISFKFEETLDVASLRAAVAEHQPDILVISAHGFHLSEANSAGLMVGDEPSMGDDLGPMPPLVILSACHSGPRGEGPVAVTDLLVRAGAIAVVSTLVPVRADRNGTFMFRLLLYLCQTVGRAEDHEDLLQVWQRVQTSSVVLDILSGNRHLSEWGYTRVDGVSPQEQFMSGRSFGRLRPPHLYKDAEAVLLEIAEEQGQRQQVQTWLRTPGYLPESMMYTMVGDPTRIRLRPLQLSRLPVPRDDEDS